jgi:glycosyltransferase involved in cell wall biosynthesis
MKILMIAPQPFFEPRGTPISVYQRLAGLSNLGHAIDLSTYHIGEDVDFENVTIHRTLSVPWINSLKVGPSWQKIPLDFFLFLKSTGLLIKNNYEVIHTHEEAGFFGVLLAWIFRTRHLYDMHSSLPKQLDNFKFADNRLMIGLFQFLERLVINSCDAMITIGPDLEQHVREINPKVPMEMIENLPLGNDQVSDAAIEKLREDLSINDKIAIVYTGTFERYQGVDLLLECAKIINNQYPEAIFVLVGGKPNQIEEYQEIATSMQLEDSVRFMGTLPIEEANVYIKMADILVSPRIEGTSVPLKIYTYLRAGKPIVATNLIAHSLVLNQETAMLVDPTKEAFAEGLMKLIRDENLRNYMGDQSQKLAEEKYNEANYLAKLRKIYKVIQSASSSQQEQVEAAEN